MKKEKSRIQYLLQSFMVMSLVFTLAACGGGSGSDYVKTCSMESPVETKVVEAYAESENSNVYKLSIKQNLTYDAVGVTYEEFQEFDDFLPALATNLAYTFDADVAEESTEVIKTEANEDGIVIEIEIDVNKRLAEKGLEEDEMTIEDFLGDMEWKGLECE